GAELRATATGAWLLPVRARGHHGLGIAGMLEGSLDLNQVWTGLRFHAAALEERVLRGQLAVEPVVRVELCEHAAELSFLVNLDEPDGFAFERGGRWALHLRLTARL